MDVLCLFHNNLTVTSIMLILIRQVTSKMSGFILEGEFTDLTKYPHMVHLEILAMVPHGCGGSILNQAIVLTAAHCFDDLPTRGKINIRYGSKHLEQGMKIIGAKYYKSHVKYNRETLYGDIALVVTKKPIVLSAITKRVVVMRNPPKDKDGFVSGWGAFDGSETSKILRHAKQRIQDAKACEPLNMVEGQFCASPVTSPSGSPTIGDSGDPLVIRKFIQIGIVSYIMSNNNLVAYTNVSYYYSWIEKTSRDMFCKKKKNKMRL